MKLVEAMEGQETEDEDGEREKTDCIFGMSQVEES